MKAGVEILADAAALRALVPQWEALAAEAAEPNPFYEHWMLLPALEAYGADGFRCAAVRLDGTLAGLFPLRAEARWRRLPVRGARSWRHRNMLIGAPLVRAKTARECWRALFEARVAPLLELEWLPADGPLYGALAEAAGEGGHPWVVTDAYTRALLVRGRDPRGRFNSNMKNNVRRWHARLAARGEVRAVQLGADGDPAAWLDEFMRLEASGWKGKAGTALACREDDRRFVAAVFPEAFRRGRLLVTGLDLGGRPLARHCMLAGGEGAFTFKIAYDEAFADCSPGILADVENVRWFMESAGPAWIDSNTARENTSYGRVWKDRRTVQRLAIGLHGAGRVAVAALPLLRLLKPSLPWGRKAFREKGRALLAGSGAA
ncbi:MAG TPA: GNAT family N-acetyltransferase [Burkholderiales bacterium]|nr:GNAT family N-acetyltransferase [Burkholderiales bacterium]